MKLLRVLAALPLALLFPPPALPDSSPPSRTPALEDRVHHPNGGREGVVVSEEEMAARIGADILGRGGNAVDAAVATGFALAVTNPRAGNIGGGGFMLLHLREEGKTIAVDYREKAPAAASRDMYLDENGEVDENLILNSYLAAGVPGTVAGLLYVHEHHGRLARAEVMAPAIELAEKGWRLNYYQAAMLESARENMSADATAMATYFKPDGSGYLPGEVLRLPHLAATLRAISEQGRDGFYAGPVADRIAEAMAANGGLVTRQDLADYNVVVREPVKGEFRGYEVYSMPPPSSGGIHLIQMLNMLETRPPWAGQSESAERLHFMAEIMRRAFADRAKYLGDPDFVRVPQEGLLSQDYADLLAAQIEPGRASKSRDIGPGDPLRFEGPDTTHFSVIDRHRNLVANTYTLNLSFGSGIVVPGTGILLNNEMDDFSAAPGVANSYGLVGGESNIIEPFKRPLSSMTPTLIFRDGEPFAAVGSPGGARIITSVFNVIVNIIDRQMNIADAIDAPRIHHQWLPDVLGFEPGLGKETLQALSAMGHTLEALDWYARPSAVVIRGEWIYGAADTRMPGGAACFPDSGC